jgi:hypothetical protein
MFLISLLALSLGADPERSCPQGSRQYAYKADLPKEVVSTLMPMAEAGQRYNTSDVVIQGIPNTQFISARQDGCRLRVIYWQGGRARYEAFKQFNLSPAGWVVDASAGGRVSLPL